MEVTPLGTLEANWVRARVRAARKVPEGMTSNDRHTYDSSIINMCFSLYMSIKLRVNTEQDFHASWKVLDFFLENSRSWKFLEIEV